MVMYVQGDLWLNEMQDVHARHTVKLKQSYNVYSRTNPSEVDTNFLSKILSHMIQRLTLIEISPL